MLDPLITKVISIGLGGMFLFAAYHKLVDGPQFRVTLLEYQLLPESTVGAVSRIVPIIEILLGGSWLVGWYAQGLTAAGSAALLSVYTFAIGINILRGRTHFDCGCGYAGKGDSEQFLSGGLVIRNLLLIVAALVTTLPATSRALGAGDYLTLVAALVAIALLFGAANQLMINRGAINTWRKPGE